MTLLRLALASLWNRRVASAITVLTIASSVALLLGVMQVQRSARESFAGVVSQTDLIVGPKGGATQLLLYTIFHLGAPIANTSYQSYQEVASHPAVEWTIPISLGDSHRGFRVVATNADFYARYRFHGDRQVALSDGRFPSGLWDVAVGRDVARELGYELGQSVVVTHGLASTGILDHDDKPFTLVGILKPTGTPIDQSVFVTLEGFEAMHIDWQSGAPPRPGASVPAGSLSAEDIRVDEITAFLVGTTSRIEALGLQREINTREDAGLMAILPGVTLSELWRVIGYAERALSIVSIFVVAVGLLGMMMTIYSSLEARRREIAILRALGMGAGGIHGLLLLEAALLSLSGAIGGSVLVYLLLVIFQPIIRSELGLQLSIQAPSGLEWAVLAGVVVVGSAMALPAALRAYRNALADGLTLRL